ncbi:tyrosine-type recombinase/integrase [uncultured Oscillibacter sp.]|uniref:tyrosine-type recombinase/integrase n=1 Tax=uncultured Oscillibacter sp. TaxID=876091 RepID=UPI00260C1368|nr:tyrosine-type recombinase/integrase [uncultured Oscillibacter sp.]
MSTILERAGCKRVRFHDLRHTFATNALEHGMDIKTLSTIIGHVSSATTLNVYAHVTNGMRQSAAAKIDRAIVKAEPGPDAAVKEKPARTTFQAVKGKYRKPGTGYVSQIGDHLWEGRYSPKVNGKRMTRNVYANSEGECEEKLAKLIAALRTQTRTG